MGPSAIMGRMAERGSVRLRSLGVRGRVMALLSAVVAATLVAACTTDESSPPGPDTPADAALRVTTLHSSRMDQDTRAHLESDVGDVLADYVAGSFLGDYPRGNFVQGFADFTDIAAGQAVDDIELLTGSRFAQASSVRATGLKAELSFLVVDGEAVGVTAWVGFEFAVDDAGATATASLKGRMSLDLRHDRWSVFAYHLRRNDSDTLPTEAVS
jgi:hypothetical protein